MSAQDLSGPSIFSVGVLRRFSAYTALWVSLIGFDRVDLAVGFVTAACATWASVRLLPVTDRKISLSALAHFAVRQAWQSLVAGVDVARRALDPRLPLRPGFITYSTGLAEGPSRNAFRALTSLQPGTLPVGVDRSGDLVIHCLDTSQPVAAQLGAEEVLFSQLTRRGDRTPMRHG